MMNYEKMRGGEEEKGRRREGEKMRRGEDERWKLRQIFDPVGVAHRLLRGRDDER